MTENSNTRNDCGCTKNTQNGSNQKNGTCVTKDKTTDKGGCKATDKNSANNSSAK